VLGFERLEEVAEIGFVEILDKGPQPVGVAGIRRRRNRLHESLVDVAFLVPERQGVRGWRRRERRLVLDVQHGPAPSDRGVIVLSGPSRCGGAQRQRGEAADHQP
jgi:hypothetical protein